MTAADETTALLFGPNGQIGRALAQRLPSIMRVIPVDRAAVDLRDASGIRAMIERTRPSLVINAAAYTAVDAAESDESTAFAVNAEAPRVMAEAAARIGAGIVHFSTDYVFDGTARTPYKEDSPTNPLNVYGRSKLAGDIAVQASGAPHLIFRTSWVYSADGKNFLTAILKKAREARTLRVVNDQVGVPTSADAVATGVVIALGAVQSAELVAESLSGIAGIYNLTAAESTTWFGFAHAVLERCGIQAGIQSISSAEYGAPALRPAYSVLDCGKMNAVLGVHPHAWRDELNAMLARMPG